MTLVVGLSAGGGYDIVARLLAPYLGKYLPGNPNVIVDNRTGAGGLVAANLVYKAAPKDGTTVLAASENLVANQLLGAPASSTTSAASSGSGAFRPRRSSATRAPTRACARLPMRSPGRSR